MDCKCINLYMDDLSDSSFSSYYYYYSLPIYIDDLGKGNFPDSKTTGHAGARVACGVIGKSNN